MAAYCRRTGVTNAAMPPRRYLWTDAFAVCNFLELYRRTGEQNYLDTALRLVEHVHFALGKYSDTDPRSGWISGLDENAGCLHPTRGGLRIGKNLAEREPDEPLNPRLEWDRDGQYFHYLTKWMHALSQVSGVTGDERYHRWALELAKASHAGFVYTPVSGEQKRMYWKMSVDLSRPLVSSMGHHDPLDALITYTRLRETGRRDGRSPGDIDLEQEIADDLGWEPVAFVCIHLPILPISECLLASTIFMPGEEMEPHWPCRGGLSIYAKAKSIYRHFAPVLIGIVFLPSAGKHQLVVRNPLTQVIIMAIVISIYSAILAVGVWQQNQNDQVNQCKQG